MTIDIVQVRKLRTPDDFVERLRHLSIEIPLGADPGDLASLASPVTLPFGAKNPTRPAKNRLSILPMEGWDATDDGRPTDLVRRRWRRFGESGAALIWGGEAVAVRPDGRANPNQLCIGDQSETDLAELRADLVERHGEVHGSTDGLVVGLQLTHSGRFARPGPEGVPRPRTIYAHPILDRRLALTDNQAVLSDAEIDDLIRQFIDAAAVAAAAGFDFVDVKHCHGYLGHEFLSATTRPGPFGGDLVGRTEFLRRITQGIRSTAPGLGIGVRLSAFDLLPYRGEEGGCGVPETIGGPYDHAFGGDSTGLAIDLTEPKELLDLLADELDIRLVCMTAGSPYYNPHIQRPAFFPPSDGYGPPEDPLVGVARQLSATAELKSHRPDMVFIGCGYSYLQEWVGPVGAEVIRRNQADLIGLGRMALSYPGLPADLLAGADLDRRLLCRTFSDCTTAPRHGMISGCYPLDPFYKDRPERITLAAIKKKSVPRPTRRAR